MKSKFNSRRGFTIIELLIVMSIMAILISIAVPIYRTHMEHAREAVLKQNLFTLRSLISQYGLDKQKAPQSLDDLVQAGYLKEIPVDPVTGQRDWQTVPCEEDTISSPDQQDQGGICDVNAPGTAGGDTQDQQQQ
jgi:general secretion pathway protein G